MSVLGTPTAFMLGILLDYLGKPKINAWQHLMFSVVYGLFVGVASIIAGIIPLLSGVLTAAPGGGPFQILFGGVIIIILDITAYWIGVAISSLSRQISP